MEYPNPGQVVQVFCDDGSTDFAYWNETVWMQGVDNDPIDAQFPKTEHVVSWSYL